MGINCRTIPPNPRTRGNKSHHFWSFTVLNRPHCFKASTTPSGTEGNKHPWNSRNLGRVGTAEARESGDDWDFPPVMPATVQSTSLRASRAVWNAALLVFDFLVHSLLSCFPSLLNRVVRKLNEIFCLWCFVLFCFTLKWRLQWLRR